MLFRSTVEMLQTLVQARDRLDPVTARKVSELWRDYEQTHRIPQEEFVAYQQLVSKADAVWHEAKERSDYALFEPYLQRIFDSCRRLAEYMQPDKDPYDAQLDRFERGLTRDTCDRFFAALRRDLVPLIGQVQAHADRVNDAPLHRDFPVAIQREFTDFVMGVMDIDRDHCIVGETEHPFTINFSRDDVRITTNYHADLVASSLYSVVHEGGHALYELHTGRELARTCLGNGVSMGLLRGHLSLAPGALRPPAGRRQPGGFLPHDQQGPALPDPHRGRRADLLPAYHGAL